MKGTAFSKVSYLLCKISYHNHINIMKNKFFKSKLEGGHGLAKIEKKFVLRVKKSIVDLQ